MVHGLVVVDQVLEPFATRTRRPPPSRVAVADVVPVERQAELVGPPTVPGLGAAGEPGDVVVLDPGRVPEQPHDGVAGAARAPVGLLGLQVVGDVDVQLADAVELVDDQVSVRP